MITQTRLKELLDYDPETRVFTWRENRSNVKAGDVAGAIQPHGYVTIRINCKKYYAHRVAYLWMEGYFPEYEVDHINRVRGDNRWENIRHVSRSCNIKNSGNRKDNTSGVKGVYWDTTYNKWHSQIMVNKKVKNLGYYNNLDDAVLTRLKTEQALGWEGCDSSSPAFKYATQRGLI